MHSGRDWLSGNLNAANTHKNGAKLSPASGEVIFKCVCKHSEVSLPTSDRERTSDPLGPVWLGLGGPFAEDKDGNIGNFLCVSVQNKLREDTTIPAEPGRFV